MLTNDDDGCFDAVLMLMPCFWSLGLYRAVQKNRGLMRVKKVQEDILRSGAEKYLNCDWILEDAFVTEALLLRHSERILEIV